MANVIFSYIKMTRPVNAAMTGFAVLVGIFIVMPPAILLFVVMPDVWLLAAAAMAAAAYGNVINDILDVKSDRVSHPDRPLVNGTISTRSAGIFAAELVFISLACAAFVSMFYMAAALVPILLLTLYSLYLKRTRIIGNLTVAALTGYALLFGCLTDPNWINILIAPAVLAFLLNFCREVVKDVQDAEGDRAAGWRTSADLPIWAIKAILLTASAIYLAAVLTPTLLFEHFGMAYVYICLLSVIPIHMYWTTLVLRADFRNHTKKIGFLLKIEMIAGLLALAFDTAIMYFIVLPILNG